MRFEETTKNDKTFKTITVARADTRGKIFDIADTVSYRKKDGKWDPFEKVQLAITEYGEGKQAMYSRHYVDLDDFLTIATEIQSGKTVSFEEFKGSKSEHYPTGWESRTLKIESWAEGNKGKGAYTVSIVTCAGAPGENGQVMPQKGADTKKVSIILSIPEAKRMFCYSSAYFNAKLTAWMTKEFDNIFPGV